MDLPALIQQYGLWAVGAGAFLEGETVLLLAGASAHLGLLDLRRVIAVAALGAFLGDNCFFLLGRHLGPRLTQRFPRLGAVVPRIERLIARWRWGAVIGLRFAYGLRMAGPMVLGATRFPLWEFVAANAAGAALWATVIAGLGWIAGQAVQPMLAHIEHAQKAVLAAVLLLAMAAYLLRRWLKRRSAARARQATRQR